MESPRVGGGEEFAGMLRDIAVNKRLDLSNEGLPGLAAGQPAKSDQHLEDIGDDRGGAKIVGYAD